MEGDGPPLDWSIREENFTIDLAILKFEISSRSWHTFWEEVTVTLN